MSTPVFGLKPRRELSGLVLGDSAPLWGIAASLLGALTLLAVVMRPWVALSLGQGLLIAQVLLAAAPVPLGLWQLMQVQARMQQQLRPLAALQRTGWRLACWLLGWWALMAAMATLLILSAPSLAPLQGMRLLAVPALAAVLCSLAALSAGAWAARLPMATLALPLLALLLWGSPWREALWTGWLQQPTLHLLAILGWPLLLRRLVQLPSAATAPRPSLTQRWQDWQQAWTRRFPTLDAQHSGGSPLFAMFILLGLNDSSRLLQQVLPMQLPVLSMILCACLCCPELHWRYQLAPGRGRRHQLGWRILAATLPKLALEIMLPLVLVNLLVNQLWPSNAPAVSLVAWATVLADLVLALTLAVLLRGWQGSLQRAQGLLGLVAALLGLLYVFSSSARLVLVCPRDLHYLGACLALWLALLPLLGPAWRRTDLSQLGRLERPGRSGPG